MIPLIENSQKGLDVTSAAKPIGVTGTGFTLPCGATGKANEID